jgi:F0F1-type ATP synthase assembly protein I
MIVTLVMSLLIGFSEGLEKALAGLGGGACAFVPALVYQLRIYLAGKSDAKDALQGAYRAEAAKFAVTTLMFAALFVRFPHIAALELFAVFVTALLVYPAALLFDQRY